MTKVCFTLKQTTPAVIFALEEQAIFKEMQSHGDSAGQRTLSATYFGEVSFG